MWSTVPVSCLTRCDTRFASWKSFDGQTSSWVMMDRFPTSTGPFMAGGVTLTLSGEVWPMGSKRASHPGPARSIISASIRFRQRRRSARLLTRAGEPSGPCYGGSRSDADRIKGFSPFPQYRWDTGRHAVFGELFIRQVISSPWVISLS
jgi:hypothetical protein